VRCHDDIGLGFDDADVIRAGYEPRAHRQFLLDYFTGEFEGSMARGLPFGVNSKSGDARISGSLASLAGLEAALESGDDESIRNSVDLILLLHGMIMSFGGIPLLYYGDEIGMLNDFSYMEDEAKANDTRWIHRPVIDWDKSELRHKHGTPEQRLFEGIARMSAVRKNTPAFADFNNRELITTGNEHLFAFMRSNPADNSDSVLVVANFDGAPQSLNLADLGNRNRFGQGNLRDLYSGEAPNLFNDQLVVPPFRFYWLTDQG
jgi:amylosucrase